MVVLEEVVVVQVGKGCFEMDEDRDGAKRRRKEPKNATRNATERGRARALSILLFAQEEMGSTHSTRCCSTTRC